MTLIRSNQKWAYYNDVDEFCCAWLAELMKDGLIAPGEIDCRSIADVQPQDVRPFAQVHMFAGVGVWSLAARLVGIPDDRPFWSASCPCPPFSTAGKVKACPSCGGFKPIPHVQRTGAFLCSLCGHEWLADGRHLWPEVWRLIRDGRPTCIVGEQVASQDGRTWLDLVRASVEILAYDAWGVDTCAAGFGAPHIRQRLYWVADTESHGWGQGRSIGGGSAEGDRTEGQCGPTSIGDAGRLADATDANGRSGKRSAQEGIGPDEQRRVGPSGGRDADRLDISERSRLERLGRDGSDGDQPRRLRALATGPASTAGKSGRVADLYRHGRDQGRFGVTPARHDGTVGDSPISLERPGPTNGLWRHADWLGCTDGKWRPVTSSPLSMADAWTIRRCLDEGGGEGFHFPLAKKGEVTNRVQLLKGAGNAVNVAQAAEFLAAVMPETAR